MAKKKTRTKKPVRKKKVTKKKVAKKKTSKKKATKKRVTKKKAAKKSEIKYKKLPEITPENRSLATQFKSGNRFWEARSSFGRSPLFSKPSELWDGAMQYFEWVDNNPLQESKVFASMGDLMHTELNKMRAMTISGLCLYLDISRQTFEDYRVKPAFIDICGHIVEVIRMQKFTGAAAGMLNAAIIARELGLSDNVNKKISGPGGAPIGVANFEITDDMDAKQASQIYKEFISDNS